MAKTGLFVEFSLDTLYNASNLGTLLALSMEELIMACFWYLDNIKSLSSENRFSLSSLKVHILTILSASEYGIFLVTCVGWHELGNKYWFLSVSFQYRSVTILPSRILQDVLSVHTGYIKQEEKKRIKVGTGTCHLQSNKREFNDPGFHNSEIQYVTNR